MGAHSKLAHTSSLYLVPEGLPAKWRVYCSWFTARTRSQLKELISRGPSKPSMSQPLDVCGGPLERRESGESRPEQALSDAGSIRGSSSTLSQSLSRSLEMSCALRSRSPWLVGSSPQDESLSRAQERINQQRERSLSHASRVTVGARGDEDTASSLAAGARRDSISLSRGAEGLRNMNDFDDASRGLPDEGRGLLGDEPDSSRCLLICVCVCLCVCMCGCVWVWVCVLLIMMRMHFCIVGIWYNYVSNTCPCMHVCANT